MVVIHRRPGPRMTPPGPMPAGPANQNGPGKHDARPRSDRGRACDESHQPDSNRRPKLYESFALPTELWRRCRRTRPTARGGPTILPDTTPFAKPSSIRSRRTRGTAARTTREKSPRLIQGWTGATCFSGVPAGHGEDRLSRRSGGRSRPARDRANRTDGPRHPRCGHCRHRCWRR